MMELEAAGKAAKASGDVTRADELRRRWYAARDSRYQGSTSKAPAPVVPPALQKGASGPLQRGDWLELVRRVDAGLLSHAEGLRIGQEWKKCTAEDLGLKVTQPEGRA